MLIEIQERDLVSRGYSLADREQWFVSNHPEWEGRTKELLGVYLTCQSETGQSRVEFERALDHVNQCSWCRDRLMPS